MTSLKPPAERLDVRVARQLGTSREEAQRVIKSGHVTADGKLVTKPGTLWPVTAADVVITGGRRPFVSRGGEKLEEAFRVFNLEVRGLFCLDVGASTGGFTDCLLKHGAARIYAVENGTGQLAPSLRDDPRVVSFEQTDIRSVLPGCFDGPLRFATVDVSFIPLTLVLKQVAALLAPDAVMVCLVKPQFEAGPGHVDKHGIVRSEAVRQQAVARVAECARLFGLTPRGVTLSPLQEGNREYLMHLYKPT